MASASAYDVTPAYRLCNGIELAAFDTRDACAFTLPNGLNSDPHTEVSACSVQVAVGHFSDPANLPGLAHYLEHLLFMGTKDFPDENSFSAFLNDKGGYSNAYTASEATNYHFEVQADALHEALHRFSGFFTCPLLLESGAARELDAVDSENSKNLQNDMWRAYQLDKATSDPSHPFHKFGTGNKATLSPPGVDVRGALVAFHAQHYSAGRATLALVGAEPTATLQAWVTALFGAFANNGSAEPAFPPLPPAALLIHRVPIKDSRSLEVSWTLPPQRSAWRAKPASYLSHLLGHEGPGSLLSALMARGWATGLYGGMNGDESCFAKFEVEVKLTPAGLAAYTGVLQLTYAYLGMLEAHGPQQWVWEEDASVRVTKFRYSSKGQPMSTATSASAALALAPAAAVFTHGRLVWDWDPAAVAALIAACTPSAAKVMLVSQDPATRAAAVSVEPWYGTAYGAVPMPAELLAALGAAREQGRSVAAARLAGVRARAGAGAEGTAAACVTGGPAALGSEAAAAAAEAALAAAVADGTLPTSGPRVCDENSYPPLTLPAPNPFLPNDFTLKHPATAARRAAEAAGAAAEEPSPFSTTLTAPPATLAHLKAAAAPPPAQAAGEAPATTATATAALPLGTVRVRREPVPQLLSSTHAASRALWWHCDDHYAQPKATVIARLSFPTAALTPVGTALMDMYCTLVMEALRELGYAASLAGLQYDVALEGLGTIRLYCGGFSQRLPVLLRRVSETLAAPHFSPAQYAMHKEERLRAYANTAKDNPINQAVRYATQGLVRPTWNRLGDLLPVAGALGPGELAGALPGWLGSVRGTVFVGGNCDRAGAVACGEALWGPLDAAGAAPPPAPLSAAPRTVALPLPLLCASGKRVVFELQHRLPALNAEDPNAAVEVVVQLGHCAGSAKRSALAMLCSQVVKEPFFDDLRTKQTLGYIVQSTLRLDAGVTSLSFRVQSTKLECDALVEKVEAFLAGFGDFLAAMPPEKFYANVLACAVEAGQADKNLEEETWRLWGEVSEAGLGKFSRGSADAGALLGVTQEEVVEFFRAAVAPGGAARRVFASMIERGTIKGGEGSAEKKEAAEEGEEEEGEAAPASTPTPAAAAEAQTFIAAPLPGVAFSVTLEAVAAALAALPPSTTPSPPSAAEVAEAFQSAGLGEVAAELSNGSATTLRLRVRCSGRETVQMCLPSFPDFAAVSRK